MSTYRYQRDIILIINDETVRPEAIDDSKVDAINSIISYVDNIDSFCRAHELVCRNKITSKRSKILDAIEHEQLKPFRFLINKN